MDDQKIENLLNISMQVTDEERQLSPDLQAGYDNISKTWEVIVKYVADIDSLMDKYSGIIIKPLLNNYAIIKAPENLINAIASEKNIEYMEKPKNLYFQLRQGKSASCINVLQSNPTGGKIRDFENVYDSIQGAVYDVSYGTDNLFGNGVIVAVIDTGINAYDSEFRNNDGTTRILNIWDQTTGEEYDREMINDALTHADRAGGPVEIPGKDIVGHGTSVAVIACGNSGVASGADIIAVKLALAEKDSFPRTTQLMEAVNYVYLKALEYNRPIAVNISFGNNYGDHTGNSLLERFFNDMLVITKSVICVGMGNEGTGITHTAGYLSDSVEKEVEIAVGMYQTSINIQIWKEYSDDFNIEIISPAGQNLGSIRKYSGVNRISGPQTRILTYYGQPSPYNTRQEIYFDMIPEAEGGYIQPGIWRLRLVPVDIVSGRFDMWLPDTAALNSTTGFLEPDSALTFTIPSTASDVISVGAYDSRTKIPAAFSGRGYVARTGAGIIAKPEIVAPGVDILIGNTRRVTGTSFATPFVTGGAALLMEWGIIRGNDLYLYADKVKAYLIKGARHLPGFDEWPNPYTGWGTLCVSESIPG